MSAAAEPTQPVPAHRVTVVGTTDLHSHIFDWDYFTDAPFTDARGNAVGLARISTLINRVRADRAPGSVLTVDNGDTIEGTPLAYYFARLAPEHPHPMAIAMNVIGYDAAAVGNHEFNYGLPLLESFAKQLNHPLLCANATNTETGRTVFPPYLIVEVPAPHQPVRVGLLGLVTPGCAIWDRANLEGRVSFDGIVQQAARSVEEVRAAGAEVVLVLCHSGVGPSSSYGDALPWPENAAGELAERVEGIDAILVGHAHLEIAEQRVQHASTGREVVLTEPLKWGMRLSVLDFDLEYVEGRWQVVSVAAHLLNAADAAADPAVENAVRAEHEAVRAYLNSPIGQSTQQLAAARSRFEATPMIDLINRVQASAVAANLADSPWANVPVLSAAAAYNPDAALPPGPVTIRDVAGLYNYDNTLVGVLITGAQLRSYLEHAAEYFQQVVGPGPFAPRELTNARSTHAPGGAPDYSYDMISGLSAPLTYDIDIARPVGSRIVRLQYAGEAVSGEQQFVLAMNNYRHSGGGNYPAVREAPVLYNDQAEIRQLIIDWVRAEETLDAATFSVCGWRLVCAGEPITVT